MVKDEDAYAELMRLLDEAAHRWYFIDTINCQWGFKLPVDRAKWDGYDHANWAELQALSEEGGPIEERAYETGMETEYQ